MDKEENYTFQELMKCPKCGQKTLHCIKKGRMLYYQCGNSNCRRAWTQRSVEENGATGGFVAFLGLCVVILVLAVLAP